MRKVVRDEALNKAVYTKNVRLEEGEPTENLKNTITMSPL